MSDHPGGGEIDKRPDVSESSRVVAASANDIHDVAMERQIFVDCNAEQLDCRAESNFDCSNFDPDRRVKLFHCVRFPNRNASV